MDCKDKHFNSPSHIFVSDFLKNYLLKAGAKIEINIFKKQAIILFFFN